MEVPNCCYLLILLNALLLPYVASNKQECGPGVDSLGVTTPRGDIFVEYGNPLEIYCSLNPAKLNGQPYNSSLMYFSYDNEVIEKDFTTVVNETTIRLYMERPPKWKKLMNCQLRPPGGATQLVCLNYVFVGEKPRELTDFNCISYNWESLNCSWTPQNNYVPTDYRVLFVLKKMYKFIYPCPGLKKNDPIPPGRNYCVWNASTDPTYRLPYSHYFFIIEANNTFGSMRQNVTIDHFASVIPHKPVNLTVYESTSESLAITWAVNYVLQNFPTGMNHRIMYQSKYDNSGSWQTINLAYGKSHNLLMYNITGLKYAHTLYDIRVIMKPVVADGDHWSEPASTTFHTNATVPGAPPRTTMGGFEVRNAGLNGDTRDVFVYWQHIPKFKENGDNFEYKFTKIVEFGPNGSRKSSVTPIIITRTYAQINSLSNYRHEFTVVSSNHLGISQSSSTIVVPAKDEMLREPDHFIKSSYGHGVWELSWMVDPNATSYTVFWCENKQDRPYECQGLLNWTHVEVGKDIKNDTAIYRLNLQVDKLYQLALSSNSATSSSGMVWAQCTFLSGKESNKLKNIWINKIGSDFIEVKWIYDCVKIHDGFLLHYCPIKEPEKEKPTCKEPAKILDVKGKSEEFANITELKPYTTYSVYFSTKKNLPLSKVLLNTTLEAAPDKPPHDVEYRDVSNTSMTVSWRRPTELNGVLRYYIVHWNNNSTKVESRLTEVTLEKLKSYSDYEIKVQACTTACSANSSAITVKTKVGTPGVIEVPTVHFLNNNTSGQMEVKWFPPRDAAAENIDFYEVLVKLSDGSNDSKDKVLITKERRLEIPTDCGTNTQSSGSRYYKVKVRAVNKDEAENLLYGPWSSSGEGNCLNIKSHPSVPVLVLMIAVGFLSVVAVGITIVYLVRYGWLRCKDMQNVGVKLPPQLELSHVKELHISPVYELHGVGPPVIVYPDFQEKGGGGMDLTMTSHACPPQLKQMDATDTVPPPDQQLLLDKKDKEESLESSNEDSEEGAGDQESSGCGSGHESVSSSITAGTHITDSGTEADERPSTPDVFGETSRRKGGSRSSTNLSSLGSSGGEGYSRLGPVPASNSGYVTVAAATRGYVSHSPMWSQNPTKGYVTVGPPKTNCD